MKKWTMRFLAVTLVAGMAFSAVAQGADESSDLVTQGELAQRLVERLGLWRLLGPNPSNVECFGVLMAAGITPSEDGWQEDEPVTAAVLARVLVLAMGGNALVPPDRRHEPEAWLDALRSLMEDMGLIETVEGAVSVLTPDEGIRTVIEWFSISADELQRRDVSISHVTPKTVREVIADIVRPRVRRPRPVTPDMPEADVLR